MWQAKTSDKNGGKKLLLELPYDHSLFVFAPLYAEHFELWSMKDTSVAVLKMPFLTSNLFEKFFGVVL